MSILEHKRNVYSQNGEDGIIEYIFKKIFEKLNMTSGNFIEFGAWDGMHLSNSYKLFNEGWEGIFIEADSEKFIQLQHNFSACKHITCICQRVGYSENDSLDSIIEHSGHSNKNFDFISIDVDGLDYFIFDKLNRFLPKVICIEVCSGHSPTFSSVIDEHIAQHNVGQSIEVMRLKAEEKGYFMLCYTGNLFLVQNEYKECFKEHIQTQTIQTVQTSVEIYNDFLEHIVGADDNLLKYLYNLYCARHRKKVQLNQFSGFVFPVNTYLKSFCQSRLLNRRK
jgi:hypothetical protein